jgi:hypothetical protein
MTPIFLVTGYLFLMVSVYVAGYLASCGWHRAKRESLNKMMSEVTHG